MLPKLDVVHHIVLLLIEIRLSNRKAFKTLALEYDDIPEGEEILPEDNPLNYGHEDFSTEANSNQSFCTFFDNRSPQVQPELRNCTWYRDVSFDLSRHLKNVVQSGSIRCPLPMHRRQARLCLLY